MEKEPKIEVPQGYEIDKQKSTFEKIVFKKIPENPKTWEEYCKQTEGYASYFYNHFWEPRIMASSFEGIYYEFSTEKRLKQFVALGKLLQLRDYWVGDWDPDLPNNSVFAVVCSSPSMDVVIIGLTHTNLPLMFPTKEMAKKFIDCFKDLVKEAYPLV